jgi:hypothetical protein
MGLPTPVETTLPGLLPNSTPCTVLVSPLPVLSGSVSLVSRLLDGSVPAMALLTPLFSVADAVSLIAVGLSFAPWIVTVTWVVEVTQAWSCMV